MHFQRLIKIHNYKDRKEIIEKLDNELFRRSGREVRKVLMVTDFLLPLHLSYKQVQELLEECIELDVLKKKHCLKCTNCNMLIREIKSIEDICPNDGVDCTGQGRCDYCDSEIEDLRKDVDVVDVYELII